MDTDEFQSSSSLHSNHIDNFNSQIYKALLSITMHAFGIITSVLAVVSGATASVTPRQNPPPCG